MRALVDPKKHISMVPLKPGKGSGYKSQKKQELLWLKTTLKH